MTPSLYRIRAIHIAEKLKLKDLRERFSHPCTEFSNYEMVIKVSEESYFFLYNYGSVVFFNVPEEIQEKEISRLSEYRVPSELGALSDVFLLEVQDTLAIPPSQTSQGGAHRVYFDRVLVKQLSFAVIKIVSMLLAESTALEYYENLIENLLLKTNTFSKTLRRKGKMLESSEDLIKFIGLCLDTKQEIISNLYIVDSPDETWENVELDRLHQDLKVMMEIDTRYRALEYKIKIIQEGVDVIVDLSKSRRETLLEMVIILLISFEIVLSIIKWRQ